MSADNLICKAFDKGWNAGASDRPRAECPFAPSWQEEKWQAWMIGYEEAYEQYAVTVRAVRQAPVPQERKADRRKGSV